MRPTVRPVKRGMIDYAKNNQSNLNSYLQRNLQKCIQTTDLHLLHQ